MIWITTRTDGSAGDTVGSADAVDKSVDRGNDDGEEHEQHRNPGQGVHFTFADHVSTS